MIQPDAIDEVLPLDDVKAHLRVDNSADDELIQQLIYVAVETIEGETGHLWGPREVTEHFARWCDIKLRSWPIVALIGIAYLDQAGNLATLGTANLRIVAGRRPVRLAQIVAATWPDYQRADDAIAVTVSAGHAPDHVPHRLRAAALLMIGDLYAARETFVNGSISSKVAMSRTVDMLLDPFRIVGL